MAITKPMGIGYQWNFYTGALIPKLEEIGTKIDYVELLCDTISGTMDGPYLVDPRSRGWFEKLRDKYPLVAHSNYGEQYGFEELGTTPAVKRHLTLARQELKSPWITDHMFYGAPSSYQWSTPVQFSKQEAKRLADRAAALQDMAQLPLGHENAFIYALFPGSDIEEADFLSEIITKANTWLHLDLHNLYANSVNFEAYDRWRYLKTIPLDRVITVHVAGGQWIDNWYHDLHNHSVPDEVWKMLEYVLQNGKNVGGVTLELQGNLHNTRSRPIDEEWPAFVKADLDKAREIWNKVRGPNV